MEEIKSNLSKLFLKGELSEKNLNELISVLFPYNEDEDIDLQETIRLLFQLLNDNLNKIDNKKIKPLKKKFQKLVDGGKFDLMVTVKILIEIIEDVKDKSLKNGGVYGGIYGGENDNNVIAIILDTVIVLIMVMIIMELFEIINPIIERGTENVYRGVRRGIREAYRRAGPIIGYIRRNRLYFYELSKYIIVNGMDAIRRPREGPLGGYEYLRNTHERWFNCWFYLREHLYRKLIVTIRKSQLVGSNFDHNNDVIDIASLNVLQNGDLIVYYANSDVQGVPQGDNRYVLHLWDSMYSHINAGILASGTDMATPGIIQGPIYSGILHLIDDLRRIETPRVGPAPPDVDGGKRNKLTRNKKYMRLKYNGRRTYKKFSTANSKRKRK
jgi:hypothetical protein